MSEKVRDVLTRLEKSGRHLLALINDVLDLSKIEAGQLTLSLSDYSMQDIVQTVFTGVESLAAEKKLSLKATAARTSPWAMAMNGGSAKCSLISSAMQSSSPRSAKSRSK